MEQKMLIVDSLNHLPENPYETITMDFCYFVSISPSTNNEMIKSQLYPLWKMYSQEFQKNVNDESVEQAVNEMLLQTEKEESI